LKGKSPSRPASRARELALDLLLQWRQGDQFADALLDRALGDHSLISEDRALAQEIFYGVLRRKLYLDFVLEGFARQGLSSLPEAVQDILRLSLYQMLYLDQVPDYAILDDACRLAERKRLGRLRGVVNGILRTIQRRRNNLPPIPGDPESARHLSIKFSLPEWIIRIFIRQFGAGTARQLGQWAVSRPPLTLRVNTRRINREQLLKLFQEKNIKAEAHPDCETGILLSPSSGAVKALPGYQQGLWQVQDASAQCVVPMLDAKAGEKIWDPCAAPGGKACHLAEVSDPKTVWLSDSSELRLAALVDNWQRLTGQKPRLWAGSAEKQPLGDGVTFDRILLDVPCSGLGVLSRRVDLRYRLQPGDIPRLADLQTALLLAAGERLRPGGVIVYSTCTVTEEENNGAVDSFIRQRPDFHREAGFKDLLILPRAGLRDGAYACRLRRSPAT
jgi:16S rRNA (cytosine967-C5)-methyltransferase